MLTAPRITFLMAVHNGAKTLQPAVESVLQQSFRDLELLIVDDGSTDTTPEILRGFADPRIRVLTNARNLGLSASLNRGIELIHDSEYVARMDADDISLPHRAAAQIAYLDANPDTTVVGSFIETFTDGQSSGGVTHYPTEPHAVGAAHLFRSALAHPSVMWRRAAMEKLRYENEFRYAQDYALWLQCVANGLQLANVPQVLLRYRLHAGQLSFDNDKMQNEGTIIRSRFLRWFDESVSEEELALHDAISRDRMALSPAWVAEATAWLEKLAAINGHRKIFGWEAFLRALTGRYIALLKFAGANGIKTPNPANSIFSPYIRPDALKSQD